MSPAHTVSAQLDKAQVGSLTSFNAAHQMKLALVSEPEREYMSVSVSACMEVEPSLRRLGVSFLQGPMLTSLRLCDR